MVRETAPALRSLGACASSCWLWPSITQRSYQTAEILGALLGVGRSRIVPEYSFLDPRCARLIDIYVGLFFPNCGRHSGA